MDIQEKIQKLRKEIEYNSYLYYVLDEPKLEDYQYDELFHELERLEGEYPHLITPDSPTQRVGGVSEKFNQVAHRVRLYSLDNSNNEEELKKWYERVLKEASPENTGGQISLFSGEPKDIPLAVELKIDGLAIALTYKNGVFVQGLTRGDGVIGEDITNNLKAIKAIPLKLFEPVDIEVRGEVYMSVSSFEKLNKKQEAMGQKTFANPRNAAAGTVRQLDPKITAERDLSIFIYTGIVNGEFKTHSETITYLKKLGFKTNNFKVVNGVNEAIKEINRLETVRKDLDYATDGVVIKVDSLQLQNELGFTSRVPKWATAYKFPPEAVWTTLNSIEIQVGRTGMAVPVAELEPVSLAGSIVSRASLYNFDEIKRLDIGAGDKVLVKKAAEIIPKVLKAEKTDNSKPFIMPENCPYCGSRLIDVEGEVAKYCPNNISCPAQIKGRLEYFVSKYAMDVEGFGESIIEQLVNLKKVINWADFYYLTIDDFMELDLVKEKSASNLFNAVQNAKNAKLSKFLNAIGIRLVGRESADILAKSFKDIEEIKNASLETINSIEGIGDKMAKNIYEYFHNEDNIQMIERAFKAGLTLDNPYTISENLKLKGLSFVITGTLEKYSRDEAQAILKSLGAKTPSSVSKNTSYVIAGANPGSKIDKAKSLNIPIIDEEKFIELIKE